MTRIDLAGAWSLVNASGTHRCTYAVPGDVHSSLISAGLIPHPYEGENELAVRWVAETEWTASRSFQWDGVTGEQGWYLDIDYLDTVAEVRVNGELVLEAANAFRRYRRDVSNALKPGENRIEILFRSNVAEAAKRQAAQPYYVPYIKQNTPIPHGNMLRKPHCHFGWDWNLAICPFGLYGQIVLRKAGPTRIKWVQAQQQWQDDGSVSVFVVVTVYNETETWAPIPGRAVITLAGEQQTVTRDFFDGRMKLVAKFDFANPELWWPVGQGKQVLHDLTVEIDAEFEHRKIGLRRIELLTPTDGEGPGSGFMFRVNGRDIFMKGANWIPADALPSACTPELTEKLLRAAVDANMNMIRIWGGGTYEQDFFYDLCDRLGLMIWHDFMFSCSLYPSDNPFLNEVKREVGQQVRRLGHHACIALWCGDNEILGALKWFDEAKANRDLYLVAYDRLNRTIEQSLKAADPTALWWPTSPSPGLMNFGDAWHDDRSGDMHFWSVWHEGRSFDHYRDVTPRFCSEFGFQSFPSMPAIRTFAKPHDMNIASAVMEAHQKNAGGNARIAETMFRYFRFPMTFEDFVYLSQVQHGLAMRCAVEYWRSLKPHCMGTLYWQLNDTWPVASWSGLDHGGAWKLPHYMARDYFAPVAVVAVPSKDGQSIAIMGLNDSHGDVNAEITLLALSVDGTRHDLGRHKIALPSERAVEIGRIPASMIPADALLHVTTQTPGGLATQRHFAPKPYKAYALRDPAIQVTKVSTDGALAITVHSAMPAYFVALECDVPGHFSDAAFDLIPGEPRTVAFRPAWPADLESAAQSLKVRDLYSATCR